MRLALALTSAQADRLGIAPAVPCPAAAPWRLFSSFLVFASCLHTGISYVNATLLVWVASQFECVRF